MESPQDESERFIAAAGESAEFTAQILRSAELTDGLTPVQQARLAAIGQLRSYAPGVLICDEHEQSDEVYIIGSGAVEVWLDPLNVGQDGGQPRRIAVLEARQTCGELALLDGGVRSAQLRAGPNGARLVALRHAALIALCEADTALGFCVMRNLASSLALRLRLQDMRLYE